MLQKAATMNMTMSYVSGGFRARVRVTNETGHKLPSGYPEGRRLWLNVKAWDINNALVYESGAYDPVTAVLTEGPGVKVYEAILGLSAAEAAATGLPPGPSFHFVLNNMYFKDNRIPPRGFTNAAFDSIQAKPVGAVFADGQYWDDTDYDLPATTHRVTATLYYQTMSKRVCGVPARREPHERGGQHPLQPVGRQRQVGARTDGLGFGHAERQRRGPGDPAATRPALMAATRGNQVRLEWSTPAAGATRLMVFDVSGRHIAALVDATQSAGAHTTRWNATGLAHGLYLVRLTTPAGEVARKVWLRPVGCQESSTTGEHPQQAPLPGGVFQPKILSGNNLGPQRSLGCRFPARWPARRIRRIRPSGAPIC